jgi:hypothetical protein
LIVGLAEDPDVVFAVTAIESHGFDMVELQEGPTLASSSVDADERAAKAFFRNDRPLRRGRNVAARARLGRF